jgi:3',5'-nucleoside bisphosphate phosphatase
MASDGDLTPGKLVALSAAKGLEAISLTDHDTLSGVIPALESGKRHAIRVIPGVEISAEYEPGMLHILGYFPSFPEGMEASLKEVQTARRQRLPRIIRKLNDLGFMLTQADVMEIAGDAQIGRPHIAKALLRKGYVNSFDEAFDEYLGKGKKAYVEKEKMTWKNALALIRVHLGLPVLAHPSSLGLGKDTLRAFIEELSREGLAGIEIHYPDHTREHISAYTAIARDMGLVITGGTDFHGRDRNAVSPGDHGIDSTLLRAFSESLLAQDRS